MDKSQENESICIGNWCVLVNKRDYQVVIVVDDSHSMPETCSGNVAVEALVTACQFGNLSSHGVLGCHC